MQILNTNNEELNLDESDDEYPISELAQPLCFSVKNFHRWCRLDFGPWQRSGELQDKTYKQQVCCLIFLHTTTSNRRKKELFEIYYSFLNRI